MTTELYLLIGVLFVFFMHYFHSDTAKEDSFSEFIFLLLLALIWPPMLAWVVVTKLYDWFNTNEKSNLP